MATNAIHDVSSLPFTKPSDVSSHVVRETVLSPRFYTTDFAALDAIDVSSVWDEWDALMREMEADPNRDHFKRQTSFEGAIEELPDALRAEFTEFLVTAMTSEFSGCILYAEIARRTKNPQLRRLMRLLARDESRHAGIINDSLKDAGLGIDLGFLTRAKKYHYFSPKFILYGTYLSEKIGYARYITVFRHLQRHPEHKFHPLFDWFGEWCNDEFRHGEAIALLIRADPSLTRGINRWWIRFFLIAVYTTMYVRDHTRPALHEGLGCDVETFDYDVFRLTSEISRQCLPLEFDTDSAGFRRGMEAMQRAADRMVAARRRGGIAGRLSRWRGILEVGLAFARLFFQPTRSLALPDHVRLQPIW
ncbi:magnesium-protoporphyrin IX monomethyl ester (oxidative) cyclase [Sphingomonas sp. SFZ2018-12]|uniref:magnesium-protoporphyrin IX monomethyl ester (oxidative) cyclase n=1 Tax=Sphingomonas sp. SFZ2018-12 TaxID=2683197 RepID=UPI001F108F69|nr:magnesium-protoporphyrin IX monomethyl ester (oxidative) cyclase [Sphingomonas sp. SFZ2018-12]MCH4894642.1 magnesium-protoporphyrin IX monomethyl ester (oxidative) cyclase [Sphingomonas sp. SFZ2018-12]